MRFYAVLQHIVEHSIPLRASDGSERREGKGGHGLTRTHMDRSARQSHRSPPRHGVARLATRSREPQCLRALLTFRQGFQSLGR